MVLTKSGKSRLLAVRVFAGGFNLGSPDIETAILRVHLIRLMGEALAGRRLERE